MTSTSRHHETIPVDTLLREAWQKFVERLLPFFLLYLVIGLLTVMVGLVLSALIIGLGIVPAIVESFRTQNPDAILDLLGTGVFWRTVLGILGVGIMAGMSISAFKNAGAILIADRQKNSAFREILSDSRELIIPLAVTYLLLVVLAAGGFFLFVLPGIAAVFFFQFADLEVVLAKRSPVDALKSSAGLVKRRFLDILVVWVLLIGVYLVLTSVIPSILIRVDDGFRPVLGLLSLIVNIFGSFFLITVKATLYRSIIKGRGRHDTGTLTPWIVLAFIGWLAVIGIGRIGLTAAAEVLRNPEVWKQIERSIRKDTDIHLEWGDTDGKTGERSTERGWNVLPTEENEDEFFPNRPQPTLPPVY